MVGGKVHKRTKMQVFLNRRRQRLQAVENRGSPGADHHRDIDLAVMVKESADKGKNDQRNRGRIDKHQHRDGVLNDGAQAHIGHGKREDSEDNRPDGVGDFTVRHFDKCLRAGGHQTDGGLEAGEGDGHSENQLTERAEIVTGNLRQGDATVCRELKKPSRLRAHENRQNINDRHENARQDAGTEHIARHSVIVVNAHAADNVNDHNAESQTRNGVHGAVAFDER